MSTLFVWSSLRNTKSFASKYSCLWRRGGAISCVRNLLLWTEGLSSRLFLEASDLSLPGPRKAVCTGCRGFNPGGQWAHPGPHPHPQHIRGLLWTLFMGSPMCAGLHCHLDPLYNRALAAFTPAPPVKPRWKPSGACGNELPETQRAFPILRTSQILQFHTLS